MTKPTQADHDFGCVLVRRWAESEDGKLQVMGPLSWDIAEAIAAARAEGRADGIEEAAKIVSIIPKCVECLHGDGNGCRCHLNAMAAIRALAGKTREGA